MTPVTTLFFDVGGVILTNGWDRSSRHRAAGNFQLDWDEFEDRHELVVSDFETGRMGLEEYLERTVFYRSRAFARDDFVAFLFAQSQPHQEALKIAALLARSRKYFMATLNNESADLNRYRIDHFHLRDYFSAFFSSCYLGVRKPDARIYRLALEITQRDINECLFVDDRALNVECARQLGMRAIHYENAAQLRKEMRRHGIGPARNMRPGAAPR